MLLSKHGLLLFVVGSTVVLLVFPVLVYLTYPDTEGSEVGLREVLTDLPVRPPPFLIGCMGYGLHRGRNYVIELRIEKTDDVIYAYWPEKSERIFLVLLPYYVNKTDGRIISGYRLKPVIASGDVALLVEVFETHKGVVGSILEIRFNNQTYTVMRKS